MYNERFELEQMPFANTADPAFFFKTAEHEEALAALFYGITQRRGVVVITGPSGSGKTLLAHMLVEQLRPEAQVALLLHTPENGHDLISSLCRELGVRHRSTQPTGELVERLRQFLSERFLEDKSVVAVVDDAQNMNVETMEHLRMLSNLEKENAKLLQIVLLGQPDLVDKLSLPQMHQVCQRVFCHRQLGPLAHDQTRAYIRHRLRTAGAKDEAVFSDEAIGLIHDRSGGLPRLINQICDNAMLAAYAIGQKTIDRELVFNCVKDMLGLHPAETGSTAAASSPPAPQAATTAPQPPIAWPATACIPPAITAAAGELDEAVRHGAEIAGRLSEINRTAQNHSGELKSLLTRAETLAAKLTESNQASTVGNIELLARLKDVNSVIGEAGRLTDRLSTGRSEAARLADRLDTIVNHAEGMAHALEAAGPKATHDLDEAVHKARTAAADVARTFAELNCTMSTAAELRAQMLGVLNDTNAIRESLRQTGSALENRSADARGLIDSLEQAQRKLDAPLSQSGILSDRLAEQIPQAGNAAERLEQQSKTLPSLLTACDESVTELRSVREQIPTEIQHLREASEQARTDLAALQAVAGIVSNQTAQADSTTKACVQENEALQSILQQARELDQRLSTRQNALPSLLNACDKRLAAMRDWQNAIPNHIQQLAAANEQARKDLAALEAAAHAISTRTVEATTATQVCSEESKTLQAILPHVQELRRQLSACQEELPALLHSCDQTLADMRGWQDSIPHQIQDLIEASRQAREELGTLQATVTAASTQATQTDAATRACSKESETLRSILPAAQEINRQLLNQQSTLPSLLTACEETLAELQQREDEIPARIRQLTEASERARNELIALQAAGQAVSAQTTQAETTSKVCAKENELLQAILPQAQVLNQELAARQQALPSLLNACDEAIAEIQQQQQEIPGQIQQLANASEQARNDLATLQTAAETVSAQVAQAEAINRVCANENESLQAILPQAQVLNQELAARQQALPSLLNACDEAIAEIQQQQQEIPGQIQQLADASEQARNDLATLQTAAQAVSAQAAQAETTSKVCAKENESLQAILPQAQVLNQELSARQQALPSLLNACDEAIAEMSHRQEELPSTLEACDQALAEMRHQQEVLPAQIQQLTEASRQAHDDLTALQTAARTVTEHTAQADATAKVCAKKHEGLRSILPQIVDLNLQLSACQNVLPTLLSSCDQTLAEMREWQDQIPIRIQELAEASDRIRNELTTLQTATQAASEQAEQTDATAKACAGENAILKSILPQAHELSLKLSNQQHALPSLLDACNEALAHMRGWQNEIPARVQQLTEAGERARADLAILEAATHNAERQAARTDASTEACAKEHEILQSILPHARELNQQLSVRQEAATPLLIACDEKLVELRGRQQETPGHIRQLATASERANKELASLQAATETASVQAAQTDAAVKESIRQNESLQSILPQARELNGRLAEQQGALPVLLDACEATLAEMQHRQEGIPAQLRQLIDAREHARHGQTSLEAITEAASIQTAQADAATHACTQARQSLELILPQAHGLNEQLAGACEQAQNELATLQTAVQTVSGQAAQAEAISIVCAKEHESIQAILPQAQVLNQELSARQQALPSLLNACDRHARDLTGRLSEIPEHLKQIDEHRKSLDAVEQKLEIVTEAATNKAGEVETILAACTDRIDDLGRIVVQASSLTERLDEARQSAASTGETCELRMAELTGRLEHIPTQIVNLSTACERADGLHKSLEADTRTARSQIDETHDLSRRIESQSQTMETQLRAIQATGAELNQTHAALKQSFSDEAIHSIRALDAKIRASLTEAILRQTELTTSTRSAEAVRDDMVQRCDLAKELAENLASVNEQADIQAARASEVSERCDGRADEMTALLGESDRAANNLADACSEAGILNDEWAQRIAMLAEENRQAFINTQQLERTSQQAEEIRGLLTRRAIAAVRQIATVQEQALRQTEETDLAADRARQVLDDLGRMKQTLDSTYGDRFIDDIESRRMQLVESLDIAARRREELIAAGANADALRQRLSESCDLLDNRLAESACQGQRIHQDLVEAVEAARVQATVAAELSERLVGQNEAVSGRIDEAKAVEADLDRLRTELVSTTIPQAVAALREQQQETQTAIAEAAGRTTDLKAVSQEALDRDARLAATIRESGEAREALENTSVEIRGQLDGLRATFEQTSRSVDARIGQLNAEVETVIGSTTERIARQGNEINEHIARLDEFADTVTRVAGEDLTRKREEINACMAQLGEQAETVAHLTGEQIATIRDEAARITARFNEQIAATGRLSSEIDDLTNKLNSRMVQADRTANEVGERADRKISMLAGETDLARTLLAQLSRIQAEINESLGSDAMRDLEARRTEVTNALNEAGARATVLATASTEAEARATQLVEANRQAVETVDSLQVSASHAAGIREQLDMATAAAVEKTGQAEELLSSMVGQITQLTTRIEDAEGNARRLESLRQALDRIVSPGFARTLEEKCSLLESLLARTADQGSAIEAAVHAAEANAMTANESAHLACEANKTLVHTLESARQETARLEESRAQAESRIDPLHAAIQLADEKAEHLRRITETTEQVRNDYGEKLEDLVDRINQADVQSRRIEGLLQQAPQFQSNLADQVRMAAELKREIDRATRRLANERRLAESAMEQLNDLRMEHLALASAAESVGTARTRTTADRPEKAVVRTAQTTFDALASLRQAVAGHELRVSGQCVNRFDAGHTKAFTCGGQG